eukprot:TRINITY_DN22068_c0_g1_i12.p1 TRINITY_DN22068_c0_g1~~TRINITY_DN22068_c0_g1_i12.p1  ORF type:complete len:232 (+),score=39.55 TRINITY_DN22068_c0_g1_i12:763-1458(+)
MLLLAGLIVVINEGLFKRVISQDRPQGSCLSSKGMPSSHAELSIGLWWYIQLEVFFKKELTSTGCWSVHNKLVVVGVVYVLLLPVPFSRVVLHDHSWAQVGVGALVGATVGTLWFVLLLYKGHQYLDRLADFLAKCKCCWGQGLFHQFVNDYYPLPDASHISTHQQQLRRARFLVGMPAPVATTPRSMQPSPVVTMGSDQTQLSHQTRATKEESQKSQDSTQDNDDAIMNV